MYFVFDYIQKKNIVNDWQFRAPNNDSMYWVNHKMKRVTSEYPYLSDLKQKLDLHEAAVLEHRKTSRFKDLTVFKDILLMSNDDKLMSFVSKHRTAMTKKFLVERSKYLESLYGHLKKKIEKRVANHKHRRDLELDEYLDVSSSDDAEGTKKNPVSYNLLKTFEEFVKNPFDCREFTQTLMSDLAPEHVLDLLFYNFFDLDIYNKNATGDGILTLGNKDALTLYAHKRRLKEMQENCDVIAAELKKETCMLEGEEQENLEAIVSKAIELMHMADTLASFKLDNDKELPSFSKLFNEFNVNYEQKYGEIGRIVRSKLEGTSNRQKWGSIISVNNSKNKFLDSIKEKDGLSGPLRVKKKHMGGLHEDDQDSQKSEISKRSGASRLTRKDGVGGSQLGSSLRGGKIPQGSAVGKKQEVITMQLIEKEA